MKSYGSQSMVAPLRKVVVRRPDRCFAAADPVTWHYAGKPDLKIAQQEHDAFVEILRGFGVEILYHNESLPGMSDAIYVFDPCIITEAGAVILRMGKLARRGEEQAMESRLQAADIPILGRLDGEAVAEGGDLLWLDSSTLAVGIGFRTNLAGAGQLEQLLSPLDIEILTVDLPVWQGPDACLHLLSLISLVDDDLAVVYPPLLTIRFWRELERRGVSLVEVPAEEFVSMGPNVLAVSPRSCLMLEGNPVTRNRLEKAGCDVVTYKGHEISLKAEGGPTCLTCPIWRKV